MTYLLYCRSLGFEEAPDYSHLRQIFRTLFQRQGFTYDYIFDWNLLKFVRIQFPRSQFDDLGRADCFSREFRLISVVNFTHIQGGSRQGHGSHPHEDRSGKIFQNSEQDAIIDEVRMNISNSRFVRNSPAAVQQPIVSSTTNLQSFGEKIS